MSDLAAQIEALAASGTGTLAFGDVTVDLRTTGDNIDNFILADNLRPGTIGQSLIANSIVNAIDAKFNAGIQPLSVPEVLRFARNHQNLP